MTLPGIALREVVDQSRPLVLGEVHARPMAGECVLELRSRTGLGLGPHVATPAVASVDGCDRGVPVARGRAWWRLGRRAAFDARQKGQDGEATFHSAVMPKASATARATPPPCSVVSASTSVAFDFTSSGAWPMANERPATSNIGT